MKPLPALVLPISRMNLQVTLALMAVEHEHHVSVAAIRLVNVELFLGHRCGRSFSLGRGGGQVGCFLRTWISIVEQITTESLRFLNNGPLHVRPAPQSIVVRFDHGWVSGYCLKSDLRAASHASCWFSQNSSFPRFQDHGSLILPSFRECWIELENWRIGNQRAFPDRAPHHQFMAHRNVGGIEFIDSAHPVVSNRGETDGKEKAI
jgi:hypothetical protein